MTRREHPETRVAARVSEVSSSEGERSPHRNRLAAIAAASLVIQLSVTLISHQFLSAPELPDAVGYDRIGRVLASVWSSGGIPSVADVERIAGTRTWGTFFFVAAVYHFLGANWLYVKLVFAAIASVIPVGAFLIGRSMGFSVKRAQFAAITSMLWPTTFMWSAMGLKDSAASAIAFLCLAGILSRRRIVAIGSACVGAALLLPVRPAMAGALLIAAVLAIRGLESAAGKCVRAVVLVAVVALWILPVGQRVAGGTAVFSGTGDRYLIGNAGRVEIQGGLADQISATVSPSNLAAAIASPLPWRWGEGSRTPYRWMYPGATLWLVLLPAGVMGGFYLGKRSHAARVILAFTITYFAVYYVTFIDAFSRQRMPVELVALMFAPMAFIYYPRRTIVITASWVCSLCVVALLSSGAITIPVFALTCGGVLAVSLLRVRGERRKARARFDSRLQVGGYRA